MSETRTFKNAEVSDGGRGITLYSRTPGIASMTGAPLGTFMHDEWDVEVTFTRKPRPIRVGDKVQPIVGRAFVGTVVAIHQIHRDGEGWLVGEWAWVEWIKGVMPSGAAIDTLKHAEV